MSTVVDISVLRVNAWEIHRLAYLNNSTVLDAAHVFSCETRHMGLLHPTPVNTKNICMTFVHCWTNVEDVGPTLYKCYTHGVFYWDVIFIFCETHWRHRKFFWMATRWKIILYKTPSPILLVLDSSVETLEICILSFTEWPCHIVNSMVLMNLWMLCNIANECKTIVNIYENLKICVNRYLTGHFQRTIIQFC